MNRSFQVNSLKVSVLIPCYNAERFVLAALSSVLDQTYRNIEVIVVDDGSTDRSADLVKEIADTRLRLLRQSNQGQCAAANTAFRVSTGDLIKFFDADDVLSPDHIERQVNRLRGRPCAIAMGQWARFSGERPEEAVFSHLPMYRDSDPADWLISEWHNARPMMQCGLWLVPRGILQQSGLWNEHLSLINDFEFFSRVLLTSEEILFTPGARLFYRSSVTGSLSGQRSRKAVESAHMSLMLGTGHLLEVRSDAAARLACANMLKDFDYTYYPQHSDLRAVVRRRINELGGASLAPDGPPGFHRLKPYVGWKTARLIQRTFEKMRAPSRRPNNAF